MFTRLEVVLTPAEYQALPQGDLRETVCVVFDILRATSSMVEALAQGADQIFPVLDIPSALALRTKYPAAALAGEREGLRIGAALTGGLEFDFGNSPREFTAERVRGRSLIMTTTNGTRALQACAGAAAVLAASFGNLSATIRWLRDCPYRRLIVVGAGTQDAGAWEDALAAGALVNGVWDRLDNAWIDDAARLVRTVYRSRENDLATALGEGRNGRRLLAMGDLAEDVRHCAERDRFDFVVLGGAEGAFRRIVMSSTPEAAASKALP